MKIGILTYHCVPNFGANLQALSTIGFLTQNGYNPIIINWLPYDLEALYSNGRIPNQQVQKHNDFTNNYLPISKLCRTEDEILEVIEKNQIDAIIVGSDAILHHVPFSKRKVFSKKKLRFVNLNVTTDRSFPNPFWGSFIIKLKKYIPCAIFSASSQNMPYFETSKQENESISNMLKQYKRISVRDEWTKNMVNFYTKKYFDVEITPDPVFAFNLNNIYPIISKETLLKKYNLPENYILISFRIPKITKFWIKKLAEKLEENNLTPVAFPMPEGLISFGLKNKIDLPLDVMDWYYLIKYSKGYIGERMHPILVSIHNNIPFFCFDEYGTYKRDNFLKKKFIPESSKIYDILYRANLLEFMVSYGVNNKITPEFVVNKILNFKNEICINFAETYQQLYVESMKKVLSELT